MTAVVFDLLHTLVDPELERSDGFDELAAIAVAVGADESAVRTAWADGYEERETTPLEPADQLAAALRRSGHRIPRTERDEIDRILGVTRDPALLRPDPDISALIGEVSSRHRIAVLSNCHEREIRCWPDSPLAPFVDEFVASSRVGSMKPRIEPYLHTCRLLGADPAGCVFVGNGSSGELRGAQAAGFGLVVHANHFDRTNGLVTLEDQRGRATEADVSVQTIHDLRSILAEPDPVQRRPRPGLR